MNYKDLISIIVGEIDLNEQLEPGLITDRIEVTAQKFKKNMHVHIKIKALPETIGPIIIDDEKLPSNEATIL